MTDQLHCTDHRNADASPRSGRRLRRPAHGQRPDADRARRRPLHEGVRQPDRARQDPADRARRSSGSPRGSASTASSSRRGVSASASGPRAEGTIARAEAAIETRERTTRRSPVLAGLDVPERPSSSSARSLAESWARMYLGDVRAGARAARAGARDSPSSRASPMSTGPRSLPARLLPLQALVDLDGAGALHPGAPARRRLGPAVRPAARAHPRVALPLLPAPARLGGRARGHRARARARRGPGRPQTVAHAFFQASLVAERRGHWVRARSYAERAKAHLRGDRRPRKRRPAAQQPRRPHLPARQAGRRRSTTSRARSRSRSSSAATPTPRRRSRRSRRCTSARARSSSRRSRRATRSSSSTGESDFLDEIGNAQLVLGRALLEQDRLDEAERGVRARRGELRATLVREPPRGRLDRAR